MELKTIKISTSAGGMQQKYVNSEIMANYNTLEIDKQAL